MAKTATAVSVVVVIAIGMVTVFVVAGVQDGNEPDSADMITAETNVARVSIQPGSADAAKVCADMNRCYFAPQTVTIRVGDTVVWKNEDETGHGISGWRDTDNGPVTAFSTRPLMPGDEYSHRFEEAGNYSYMGVPGPWKTGKVIVEE